jgi:hypothetical protein
VFAWVTLKKNKNPSGGLKLDIMKQLELFNPEEIDIREKVCQSIYRKADEITQRDQLKKNNRKLTNISICIINN